MIPKRILQKVKHIEIRTKGLVNDLFSGEYHSAFKGQGMTFSEVREYYPGDDIRMIDSTNKVINLRVDAGTASVLMVEQGG